MAADLDALAGLEEQRDFLLRSLRDLEREREAGDLDEADYQALRDGYTVRAAAVLRALEEGRAALPPPRPRRPLRAVLMALAVAAAAVGAGLGVAASSGERPAGAPSSGSIRESSNTKLARARDLVARGEALEAIKLYDEVLAGDPANPEALTYRGWITRLAGQSAEGRAAGLVEKGLEYLDRALEADPGYSPARLFRGIVLLRDLGRPAEAVAELERFLASGPPPEMAAMARPALEEARAAAG